MSKTSSPKYKIDNTKKDPGKSKVFFIFDIKILYFRKKIQRVAIFRNTEIPRPLGLFCELNGGDNLFKG
jgi:hypothetical protein